ncbi:heavy metal sensor histidine kinase [Sedimenticola sp.]|uniref:heavy metal sensor histidine kinase n=1 Tax=Sedimenticola sp. TaxID=1940285 RepID=UPI00258CC3EB|nr:heavy metal sensor histidine kinase [Sedimenticola sp.]MCW8902692.1 heavy metal sensor histidine kinase [Sedimenticola sp.]
MFSKNADADSDASHGRKKLFRFSIKRRLILLYSLSAFTMMTAVTVFQDWVLIRGLERDEVQLVSNKVHSLLAIVRHHGDNLEFLDHQIRMAPEYDQDYLFYSFHSRILDEEGRVLISTSKMDSILPASVFPSPVIPAAISTDSLMPHWKAINGRSYFLVSTWTNSGGDNGPRRVIQVALDDTGEHALIAEYRRYALLALALGTIIFAGIGALIARAGLQPVDRMAMIAEQITANELKIPPALNSSETWPEELTTLAGAFSRMLSRLEESFTRCSKCVEDLAHELRTPINNVLGETEVTLSRTRTAEEYQQVLSSNIEECARLARFINEMLLIARADNPQTEIRCSWLNVRQTLDDLLAFHDAQAQEKEIEITCHGDALLYADPVLFQHAVSNLIANALNHTPSKGQISLTACSIEQGVEVTVQDTGCGIPAEDLQKVFERYYHPGKTKANSTEGTGLGLSIVKAIMKLHGGIILIDSRERQGSIFRLQFPLATHRHDNNMPHVQCITSENNV